MTGLQLISFAQAVTLFAHEWYLFRHALCELLRVPVFGAMTAFSPQTKNTSRNSEDHCNRRHAFCSWRTFTPRRAFAHVRGDLETIPARGMPSSAVW
jgi:hypothetical protein